MGSPAVGLSNKSVEGHVSVGMKNFIRFKSIVFQIVTPKGLGAPKF